LTSANVENTMAEAVTNPRIVFMVLSNNNNAPTFEVGKHNGEIYDAKDVIE
jgi:hypothetical protein